MPALYSLAVPAAAARAVRRRRRRPHRGVRREFRERDEGGGAALRARRVPPGRLGRARRGDALLRARRRRRGRRGPARRRCSPRSTRERGTQGNRVYYLAVPPSAIGTLVSAIAERRDREGLGAADRREAVRPRPRLGAGAERADRGALRRSARSSGSTTTSARRRCRTCSRCGSRTASSSRSGTASSSTTSRSRSPSRSGIEGRAAFYEQAGAIRDVFQNHLLQLRRAHGDGAADRLHRRLGAQREGEGAALAAHAGPEVGRPRPVRARVRRGRRGAGLSRGGGRRARLDDRDVRRGEALRRQLALGGHAVLRAHGQAARAPRDDDRDPVQARAASAVRGGVGRGPAAERAADPRAAERGHVARRSARRCPGSG